MSALLDSLASSFDTLPAREAGGLGGMRRAALDAALHDGLPHARVEAWKYTSLRALERRTFAPADAVPVLDTGLLADIPSPRIVFVNGRFHADASDLTGLPAGVSLRPLSQVLDEGDAGQTSFLARKFERSDEVFAKVNAALATEGVVLRADANARATTPVHLVFAGTASQGDQADQAWHLRHLIELSDGAELGVVEHQLGGPAHRHFANAVMHVHLGKHARLSHARVQDESTGATLINRTDAVLAGQAEYRRLDLELGAALSRHELNVALQGDAAKVHANGVLLGDGRRHLDTRLGVDHTGRDTACELTWRGIGTDRARVVFHGGILIREGADGTDATLSNKNLLLSEGAEIDTQPVLIIHADEVQAAHGATVGQLDPTALFYLRSRGLPAEQARTLLTGAFCRETLSVFDDAGLRDAVAARLDTALARSVSA
ncbi:ABC transporter permease [Lysobacter concretionis Ko07 = DSM 16239]|jgi:Fe-S cluster assembly protein SufD|uniref:ABC transporter permease n=1 Tax=Lysobacter concretionis Ko07 = DSM 16239 TaxID=1122185 RepID=A0A0A0EPC1_9GAMM|nr:MULTISPECIES: Fe-S cluster assembly protein SufD [Lysobacter]KGM51042.1 ABC transporter permease [Lysobacter concretionis Ko07 = DSM 16239]QOD90465.1 Fe-S cluster assembly protein SufD [Lysobacter sp. CW239]